MNLHPTYSAELKSNRDFFSALNPNEDKTHMEHFANNTLISTRKL